MKKKNYPIGSFVTALPETASKPLALLSEDFIIAYSNDAFQKIFEAKVSQSITKIQSEPDLLTLLHSFFSTGYNAFSLDVFFQSCGCSYNLEAERVKLKEKELFLLIFDSIEEKQRIESKINNLYNAIEYGAIPVLMTDVGGRITFISKSFEQILKQSLDTLYLIELPEILKPLLTERELKDLKKSFSSFKSWNKIIAVNNKEEEYFDFTLTPIRAMQSFILVANNLTQILKTNRSIRKSEYQLKSIINNISDMLLVVKRKNMSYFFEIANDSFCSSFNVNKAQALNKLIDEVLQPDFVVELMLSFKRIDREISLPNEFVISKDSKNYFARVSYLDDKYEDEKFYIISLRDYTDQIKYQYQLKKAYERESQLNKLKTVFLENMSHEIRTPFNALMGYSEIIDDCIKAGNMDELREFTLSIKDVLSRVLNLFTNIVEVFQIESAEIKLEYDTINCVSVIKNVFNNKFHEAKRKKLNFLLNISAEHIPIKTDWIKFEKIISALVDNSIKYTDRGEIIIDIIEKGESVMIFIIDTGSGIHKLEMPRLLEPFEQHENGYTRKNQGAGLGLTIAYKLTRLLGGRFEIKSANSVGTKIGLTFPVER